MNDKLIARTGRVQSWIDNPESRLPVSCTVFQVEDSIEGPNGIEASWRFVSHALRFAAGAAVHLSKLRPRGTESPSGLVASGPVSFAKIYSTINEVIRRGGHYKGGAVCIHLNLNHRDILHFITATRAELPWIKRCVDITPEWWNESTREVRDALLLAIKSGDIWLNKVKFDQNGEQIYGNVCLEIYLKPRGTCLLQHLNLGQCHFNDIHKAFTSGMNELVSLHARTGVDASGEYLSPLEDRQVGLGLLGLANFLRIHGLTYKSFGEALKDVNDGKKVVSAAHEVAKEFKAGVDAATIIAKQAGMERAFTIAPTASCSYRHQDLDGYTTAPEIAPPISRQVDRDSGTFGVESFDYGPVETAAEVGWEDYKRVADEICRMFESTMLFHGYSFNSWSDVVTYDDEFIEDWIDSPQTSMYYALQVAPDTLRKDDASAILDEDYSNIFDFKEEEQYCVACAE